MPGQVSLLSEKDNWIPMKELIRKILVAHRISLEAVPRNYVRSGTASFEMKDYSEARQVFGTATEAFTRSECSRSSYRSSSGIRLDLAK